MVEPYSKLSLRNEIIIEADTKCLPLNLSLQPTNKEDDYGKEY